jgi:WD40 repeat protein
VEFPGRFRMRFPLGQRMGSLTLVAALAALLSSPASGGLERSAAAGTASAAGYRILLQSDRDGRTRGYSIRPDGSLLTPLVPANRALVPMSVSDDGATVAYAGPRGAIYVSRGSGAGLRRLGAAKGGVEALTRDGKLLAFSKGDGLRVIGTDGRGLRRVTKGDDERSPSWSPDGNAFVYEHQYQDRAGGDKSAVIVQPLRGKRRVLARASFDPNDEDVGSPAWSPDGRWIAYVFSNDDGSIVRLVRPNGTGLHSVPGNGMLAWAPDGKSLAVAIGDSAEDVAVVGVDGRVLRRLRLAGVCCIALSWSPDARQIILAGRSRGDPVQIWVVGADGKGLTRLTNEGNNSLVGSTLLAPILPPAPPVPPTEAVVSADTVATRTPVKELSADGSSVAFVAKATDRDCDHVAVWSPGATPFRRFGGLPAPCVGFPSPVDDAVLAGSRVAWVPDDGTQCQLPLVVATFADPTPVVVGRFACSASAFHVHGDGDLLVFDGSSGLVRVGGSEPCDKDFPEVAICTTLRRDADAGPVESVAGGLIAVLEPGAVAVLNQAGTLVRRFRFSPADVSAARLDGGRLVVWRFGVLETYDVASGAKLLSRPMPSGYRLADVDGGIAVLLSTDSVILLRLDDGRSLTIPAGGASVLADLEPPGLYYSYATGDGGGRVVFVPRGELPQQLIWSEICQVGTARRPAFAGLFFRRGERTGRCRRLCHG